MLFYIPLCNMVLRDVADLFEGEGIVGLEVGDVQTAFLEGFVADAGNGKVGELHNSEAGVALRAEHLGDTAFLLHTQLKILVLFRPGAKTGARGCSTVSATFSGL